MLGCFPLVEYCLDKATSPFSNIMLLIIAKEVKKIKNLL